MRRAREGQVRLRGKKVLETFFDLFRMYREKECAKKSLRCGISNSRIFYPTRSKWHGIQIQYSQCNDIETILTNLLFRSLTFFLYPIQILYNLFNTTRKTVSTFYFAFRRIVFEEINTMRLNFHHYPIKIYCLRIKFTKTASHLVLPRPRMLRNDHIHMQQTQNGKQVGFYQ